MTDKYGNGIFTRLGKSINGHRYSILSVIGGLIVFIFSLGGAWMSMKSLANEVESHVQNHDQYVQRRELNLSLEPLRQDMQNIKNSLEQMRTRQARQNQMIIQELRRMNQNESGQE